MLNSIKESYKELVEKVSWPTFAQLQSSTIVVMVASLIFALVVLVMDISFENLMKGIYSFLGNIGLYSSMRLTGYERDLETMVCDPRRGRYGE